LVVDLCAYTRYRRCMTTGERIRHARTQAGLSLRQLAGLIECSHVAICDWENGHRRPSDDTLKSIASYCGVTFDWLQNGRLSAVGDRTLKALAGLPADEQRKIIELLETTGGAE